MQTFSINFIVPQELTKWQKDTSLTEIRCRFDGNLEEIVETLREITCYLKNMRDFW